MSVACGWYVPTKRGYSGRQRARWVLSVGNGRVLYAKGGLEHYEYRTATFEGWIRRVAATLNPHVVASNKPESAQLELV